MALVVDCSVSVGWFFAAQSTPYAVAVSSHLAACRRVHAWVPALWGIEMANVLRTACRRGKLDAGRAQEILAEALRLPLRFAEEKPLPGEVLALALRHDLSAYDASYLDLALRLQLPIATQDAALREAALASGVGVWRPA